MKIDLNEMERQAHAAPAGLCRADGGPTIIGTVSCPAITLALIARIRELERALAACYGVAGAIDIPEILERGAVLDGEPDALRGEVSTR